MSKVEGATLIDDRTGGAIVTDTFVVLWKLVPLTVYLAQHEIWPEPPVLFAVKFVVAVTRDGPKIPRLCGAPGVMFHAYETLEVTA
jgi:hypothetical protein